MSPDDTAPQPPRPPGLVLDVPGGRGDESANVSAAYWHRGAVMLSMTAGGFAWTRRLTVSEAREFADRLRAVAEQAERMPAPPA